MRRPFTAAEDARIRRGLPGAPVKRLARELGRSPGSVAARARRLGLGGVLDEKAAASRFQKGQASHTRGRRQAEWMGPAALARSAATRFKKGNAPHNAAPEGNGAVRARRDSSGRSYLYRREAPGRWLPLHRLLWEEANGPVPAGHCLRFRDGDPANCAPGNIELVTRAENARRNQDTDRALASRLARLPGRGLGRAGPDPELRDRILADAPGLVALRRAQRELRAAVAAAGGAEGKTKGKTRGKRTTTSP